MPKITHRKVIPIGAPRGVVAQRAPDMTWSGANSVDRGDHRPAVRDRRLRHLVALPLPLPGAAEPIWRRSLRCSSCRGQPACRALRSAVHRVAAVVTGVLLAIALADLAGFTWWSLGLTIAAGLAVGSALHLGDAVLEVPVSAMFILSNATRAAAVGRIAETAIGTAAGLIAGFVFTRPRLQPAEEAIEDLCRKLSGLLTAMADGLAAGSALDAAGGWLARARSLSGEVRRVDDALREAEESLRLNPRGMRLPYSPITLRQSLETLEHEAITVRVLARSMADSTRLPPKENPLHDPEVRRGLAAVLRELATTVTTYGRLATEHDAAAHDRLEAELERHLAAARDQQDRLGELMRADPAAPGLPLAAARGAIRHLDRLRYELGRASRDARPGAAAAPGGGCANPAPARRGACSHRTAWPGRYRQVAVHGGDPRSRGRGGRRGARLPHRVHVPVELGGVVGHLDLDVPRVHLGLAPERLLDGRLDGLRAGRRPDGDEVPHPGHPADVVDHPLDLALLVVVVHLAVERDPAVLHPGVHLPLRDLHVPLQDVRDRPGDVGVVPRRPGELHLQVVGHGLDPVDPFGRPGRGQLLGVARHVAGQRHRPSNRHADRLWLGDPRSQCSSLMTSS
jgi:hypothetical protein